MLSFSQPSVHLRSITTHYDPLLLDKDKPPLFCTNGWQKTNWLTSVGCGKSVWRRGLKSSLTLGETFFILFLFDFSCMKSAFSFYNTAFSLLSRAVSDLFPLTSNAAPKAVARGCSHSLQVQLNSPVVRMSKIDVCKFNCLAAPCPNIIPFNWMGEQRQAVQRRHIQSCKSENNLKIFKM